MGRGRKYLQCPDVVPDHACSSISGQAEQSLTDYKGHLTGRSSLVECQATTAADYTQALYPQIVHDPDR